MYKKNGAPLQMSPSRCGCFSTLCGGGQCPSQDLLSSQPSHHSLRLRDWSGRWRWRFEGNKSEVKVTILSRRLSRWCVCVRRSMVCKLSLGSTSEHGTNINNFTLTATIRPIVIHMCKCVKINDKVCGFKPGKSLLVFVIVFRYILSHASLRGVFVSASGRWTRCWTSTRRILT